MHPSSYRSALNRRPLAARAHAWLAWLLIALVMAPALGLVHGLVHTHPGRTLHGAPVALAQDTPQGAAHAASTWIKRLLPAHGDGDCRLYDQLAHGDMAPGMAVLVPTAPAVLLSVWAPAVPDWVRHVARCRAREPPRTLTLLPTALGA